MKIQRNGHGQGPPFKISQKKKKKNVPIPIFLQRGPKKCVESEYHVCFGLTWAKKIRNGF